MPVNEAPVLATLLGEKAGKARRAIKARAMERKENRRTYAPDLWIALASPMDLVNTCTVPNRRRSGWLHLGSWRLPKINNDLNHATKLVPRRGSSLRVVRPDDVAYDSAKPWQEQAEQPDFDDFDKRLFGD